MKKKYKWNPSVCFMNLFTIIYIGWITLSFAEVLMKNLSPNPVYSIWNLFIICGFGV